MNLDKYKVSLYAIVAVILAVICIQVYWNILNYKNNKQQLINDVQVSLDNAVDTYYNNLAEHNTLGLSFTDSDSLDIFDNPIFDKLIENMDGSPKLYNSFDSIKNLSTDGVTILKGRQADSLLETLNSKTAYPKINLNESKYDSLNKLVSRSSFKLSESRKTSDTIENYDINLLTSKVVISITSDSIPLQELDTIIKSELKRKNINSEFGLLFRKKDSSVDYLNKDILKRAALKTASKSSFLPSNTNLTMFFQNVTKEILYRSITGILISLALVISIIAILFYLLRIIRDQKQLAEIKNDLISNITHEFKTPIATVGVALESMKDFNVLDDKEKANRYIDMSENQLSKLNTMVEKLLETASLDSENLSLNKENINLVELTESVYNNHKFKAEGKTIEFNSKIPELYIEADAFHLENAISNLLDNALKYGGNHIEIRLAHNSEHAILEVKDDGKNLTKDDAKQIFDKFYRVPKGNTHDVKGFGIGLYYTKKIVEKHGGSITVQTNTNGTNFKLRLPNARI